MHLKNGGAVKICGLHFGEQLNVYYRVYANPIQNDSHSKLDDWLNSVPNDTLGQSCATF